MRYMVATFSYYTNEINMEVVEANTAKDAISIWLGEGPGYFDTLEQALDFNDDLIVEVAKIDD